MLLCSGITHPEVTLQFDVKIHDGFVVVHALPRGNLQHPLTRSVMTSMQWINRRLGDCQRIHVLWDLQRLHPQKGHPR